ncbi:hypothetical protein AVEN_128750-1 [Araneus ventricosus]|uniref:EGF-like domain-containing protein n=1 Tax=Araneus ventricosus TaxID=182803 RepID=A0A4Y2IXI9_ARAVE|nr:hypothetical protein AVEN_128750-1 [Araneus ventricosus]
MEYFVFVIVLCLGLLCQNGLSEKLTTQEKLVVEKNFNSDKEAYNQDNHALQDPFPNNADCNCRNGKCVTEDRKEVCKCNPGYGYFTSSFCKACDCGPNQGCKWKSTGWYSVEQICFCNPGYFEDNGKCVDPVCQQGTIQSGGASVMVWDVCSWRDMGPLIRLDTTLTGGRYLSILPDHLHSFMSIVHSDGLGQFHQDNVKPHASRVATKWLQEHSSNFRHFHWPPKSPEMNIIEDIRDALLHAVEKRSASPRTPMDLLTALQDLWCEFPPGYLQTPVESMARRFASLLRARGGPTRY